VVALGVFNANARYLVPVGGMVIGNAMTAAAVSLNRVGDEVAQGRAQIEATLALGVTASQAMRPILTRSLRSGMIPLIDSTKTTGLIFFPGTMVGDAARRRRPRRRRPPPTDPALRAARQRRARRVIPVLLAYRNFFTAAHQLHEPPSGPS
jgi:putative ABC transport system permease protein